MIVSEIKIQCSSGSTDTGLLFGIRSFNELKGEFHNHCPDQDHMAHGCH